ncbi:MAG: YqaJ viral recombinase family protein [Verrucomicrobiota bacterium]
MPPSNPPYQIVALVERTDAWWAWRRGGIGSADAATALGEKWAKSTERLLYEKQHPPKDSGRHFVRARGAAFERAARAHYVLAVGFPVEPTCVQSLARPWQRASLDGLSADGARVVEIKCGLATYQSAVARRRPPRHHVAQLQHILAVTGLPVLDYWCHCPPHPPLRLEVRRDDAYIERLLAAEEIFWQRFMVTSETQPL